jgi:hypothetical protein
MIHQQPQSFTPSSINICNRILRQRGKIFFQFFKSGVHFLDEKWKRDAKKEERAKNCTNIYTDINYYGKLKEPT